MSELVRVSVTRQDIANPDKGGATLVFRELSDGDVEMTVMYGDPERDRGAYLIAKDEAWDLVDHLDVHLRRWVKAHPE